MGKEEKEMNEKGEEDSESGKLSDCDCDQAVGVHENT
jgi:hypothetical protein